MVDRYAGRGAFRNNSSSCSSCGCNDNKDCQKLKQRLQAVDFSLIDTVLYLDAYPDSCEALGYYHKLKKERQMLMEALSESCNMPITSFDNACTDSWNWTDSPWPWEPAAN